MLELREKNGPGAVAELIKDHIANSKSDVILIDGVRSIAEVEVLKNLELLKFLQFMHLQIRDSNFYLAEEDPMHLKTVKTL